MNSRTSLPNKTQTLDQPSIETIISTMNSTLERLDKKIEQLDHRLTSIEQRVDKIQDVVNEIKEVMEEDSQTENQSWFSSFVSRFSSPPRSRKLTNSQKATSSSYSRKFKVNVFVGDRDYDKTISDVMNVFSQYAKQRYSVTLLMNIITHVEEADDQVLTLFVKYCGTSRFESKEARWIAEMKKALHFILLRYGETRSEVCLSDIYSMSSAFEFHVNNLEDKKVLFDNPRNKRSLDLLCNKLFA
ncbi:hypothetical protein FDP41_007977 [Naegleria fowleri]|uniref:Uncharacterized protein n=1 Tax=Naegleria fowleri TaxID=5763 RepID=A0A6A5CAN9_NAEFO|nr:uncharacterized protein FDP41_007977 [Naegleria fowleri]KAF0984062.1 hypothetical protein FDP41_007977 [Naegleria fowleri]